jgi:hypothetical protein
MSFYISDDQAELKAFQTDVDAVAGYPESLSSLRWVGTGIHCPKEYGRALHYAEVFADKTGTKHAITFSDKKPKPPKANKHDELPADWWPEAMLMAVEFEKVGP